MTNVGGLFSSYFLDVGITGLPAWAAVDGAAVNAARRAVAALIADFTARAAPGEADTERDLIEPRNRRPAPGEVLARTSLVFARLTRAVGA